jgi:hypothetical protein
MKDTTSDKYDRAELLWETVGVLALGPDPYQCRGELAKLSQNTTNKWTIEMPQRLKDCIKGDGEMTGY